MNIVATTELKSAEGAIRDVIYRACLLLDDEKFLEWLTLCAPDFKKHNTDHGRLTRHATVYTVEADPAQNEARTTTSFACYRTMLDGINSHIDSGETQLFLIGRYYDRFRIGEEGPRFLERNVFLDTRRLDKGSHYPI